MRKVKTLLKYSLMNQFGKSSGSGNSKINNIMIYSVVGIILFVAAIVGFSQVNNMIIALGAPRELFLLIIYLMIASIVFATDVIKAPGLLFNVKDYQMLSTLPVTSKDIIIAKLIELLLNNYVFAFLISIPGFLIYFRTSEFSVMLLVLLIISILVIPMIPMSFGVLIGYVIYKISSKFKFREVVITSIYMMVMFFGILLIYSMEKIMPLIIANADIIISIMTKLFLPIQLYLNMLMELSILDFVLFTGISLICFAVLIFIIKNQFTILNSSFDVSGKDADKTFRSGKKQSKVISLLKLEFLKYISKSVIVLNTLGSGVLYLMYIFVERFNLLGDSMGQMSGLSIVLGALMLGMTPTTTTSISLEGKAFNIKKSLPIRPREVILAKVLLNIMVLTPIIIVGGVLTLILGTEDIMGASINALVLIIVVMGSSTLGMLINLNIYDLNWTSEAAVVKKSKSVLVMMVPSFVVFIIVMVPLTTGGNVRPILAGAYGVIFIIASLVLFLKGEKMYNKIS